MPRKNYKPTGNPAHRPLIIPGEPMKSVLVNLTEKQNDHCKKQPGGVSAYLRRLIDADRKKGNQDATNATADKP